MAQGFIKTHRNLEDTVNKITDRVTEDPEFGKFTYTVNTHWEGGVLCKANIRRAHSLVVDEPPELGGCDLGASPVELVLAALGTSQEIMYSTLASKMGIELEECDVSLTGEFDVRGLLGIQSEEVVNPGFSCINYVTTIKSSATKEKLQMLVDAVQRQCPILDMLTRNVNINGSTTLDGKEEYKEDVA